MTTGRINQVTTVLQKTGQPPVLRGDRGIFRYQHGNHAGCAAHGSRGRATLAGGDIHLSLFVPQGAVGTTRPPEFYPGEGK
jgi:hypothetical protein